ncbi:MAG: hypothetical protein NTX07_06355 [Solirubrobacterales bacterium]|nr:hypothetical protein [Solirubrobacterales bacterium]
MAEALWNLMGEASGTPSGEPLLPATACPGSPRLLINYPAVSLTLLVGAWSISAWKAIEEAIPQVETVDV